MLVLDAARLPGDGGIAAFVGTGRGCVARLTLTALIGAKAAERWSATALRIAARCASNESSTLSRWVETASYRWIRGSSAAGADGGASCAGPSTASAGSSGDIGRSSASAGLVTTVGGAWNDAIAGGDL